MNGWMRLWVVLSALYLTVGFVISIGTFPTKEGHRGYWVFEGIQAMAEAISAHSVYGGIATPDDIRNTILKGKDDEAIVAWFQDVIVHPQPHSEIYAKALETVNVNYVGVLPPYQRDFLTSTALILLIPVVSFLILGWAFAWVVRGFRKPPLDRSGPNN